MRCALCADPALALSLQIHPQEETHAGETDDYYLLNQQDALEYRALTHHGLGPLCQCAE